MIPMPIRRALKEPPAGGALVFVNRSLVFGWWQWQADRNCGEARR
jgi:hypothetical protein